MELHELERIGRGREELREKGIGIQRDWRDERIELVGRDPRLIGGWCGRLCRRRRQCGS